MEIVGINANIMAKLESIETALVLFVILFTAAIPVCQSVGVDNYYITYFFIGDALSFVIVSGIILLRLINSKNKVFDYLNTAFYLEDRYIYAKYEDEKGIQKISDVDKRFQQRNISIEYEKCYLLSLTQATSPFQCALKKK